MTTEERTWQMDLSDDCAEFSSDAVRTATHVFVIYVILDDVLHVSFEGSIITGFTIAAVRVFDAETRYFDRTLRRVTRRAPRTKDPE